MITDNYQLNQNSKTLRNSAVHEQFRHRGNNEIFVANIVKLSTFNKDVLDSEWALTSRALRLVCTR